MKFNSFLWQNFLESKRGQEWIAFFQNLGSRYESQDEQLVSFIGQWTATGSLGDRVTVEEQIEEVNGIRSLLAQAMQERTLPADPLESLDDAETYFGEGVRLLYWTDSSGENPDEAIEYFFREFDIPALSIALHCFHPRFFFPYYFYPRFYTLKQIFDEFRHLSASRPA